MLALGTAKREIWWGLGAEWWHARRGPPLAEMKDSMV